eukprot:gene2332-2800_t
MKFPLVLLILFMFSCFSQFPRFGREMKLKMFQLKPNEIYINHGSYGAVPHVVQNYQKKLFSKVQENPLRFMTQEHPKLINQTIERVSKYINAEKEDVVLIENASAGINSVLRSTRYNKGDKILITSIGYNSVKTTLEMLKKWYKIEVVIVDISLPTTEEKIIKSITKSFTEHKIKLAVIDHISSFPSLTFPIKQIIKIARNFDVKLFVDGAHAIGQIPINIKDLDPDYYISNGHKWLCSSHGSAFMYVKKSLQSEVHPPVQSHFYGQGFQKEFHFTGTRDYTPMYTFIPALDFRDQLKDENVWTYNNNLCLNAAKMLIGRWNTTGIVPFSMNSALINIKLPCSTSSADCWRLKPWELQKILQDKYDIWSYVGYSGKEQHLRISCQIYNEMNDYVKFADALEEIYRIINKTDF